jgi:hypothetical protein
MKEKASTGPSTTAWTYADRRVVRRGDTIRPVHVDASAVAVIDLLP